MRSVLAAAFALSLPFSTRIASAQTTSGSSTYAYSMWELTRWNLIEWRTRCDGGPRGMESGPPTRWTVEFRSVRYAPPDRSGG